MKASPGVARSYAKAIFELARERQQADAVQAELERIAALITGEDETSAVLSRPWVAGPVKQRIVAEIARGLELSKLSADFLGLVAAQGRADHLGAIAEAYRALLDAERGRVRARVRTAVPLTDADRAALTARLGRALGGKQIVMDEVVDKNLLGGFVADIGSLNVDGSLDGQLARLRERLARG